MVTNKHLKTLGTVFETPTRSNIRWSDIEKMIIGFGGQVEERAGSRVIIRLKERKAVFHRPHPKPETDKGAVVAMRRFLENAGLTP